MEAMYIVTTVKKAKHLEPLKGGKIPVEILAITKDPEQKTRAFEKCLDVIKGAGVRSSIATTDISFGLGTVLTDRKSVV